jgi:hypothetical protein
LLPSLDSLWLNLKTFQFSGASPVGADKTVVLGDPFQFNKEHIDLFDF